MRLLVIQRAAAKCLLSLLVLSLGQPVLAMASLQLGTSTSGSTEMKQAAFLASLSVSRAGRSIWPQSEKMLPPSPPVKSMPFITRDMRKEYAAGDSRDRRNVSERAGDQAGARYAREQGWKKKFGSKLAGTNGRGVTQGPDSGYWDPHKAKFRVPERKGGKASLNKAYGGALQGTNRYSIRAASEWMKSTKVPFNTKVNYARILVSAQDRTLDSGLIRGGVRGASTSPKYTSGEDLLGKSSVLQKRWRAFIDQLEARSRERKLRKIPELDRAFREARKLHRRDLDSYKRVRGGSRPNPSGGRAMAGLTMVASTGLLLDAYQQSSLAIEMFEEDGFTSSGRPYLQSAFAIGRATEGGLLLAAASKGGSAKSIGKAAGKKFLPVAILTETLGAGIAYFDYSGNRISSREFYRSISGPAVFVGFTTAGAIIGAAVGSWAGGVGAIPGAGVGAKIGAFVAIPFQWLSDWVWNGMYREFDEGQLRAIDTVVFEHYGVALAR